MTTDDIISDLTAYERACLAGHLLCGVAPVFTKAHDLGLVTRVRDCGTWRYTFTDQGADVRDRLRRFR